jgi:hypothetical protein
MMPTARSTPLVMRLVAAALCAGVLAGAPGCGGANVNVAETHVGKEELFKTGSFDYDEFFEDVYGLQGSGKAIANDEKSARAPLSQALGVGETSIDRLLEVLRDKAGEFAQSKNRVHFAIEGGDDQGRPLAGKSIEVTPSAAKGRAVPKEATDFASALAQTADKEGQVWEKYAPLAERGKRLEEKADALVGSLEKEFASSTSEKREEIRRELKAAKLVSSQIGELAEKVVNNSLKFVKQSGELLTAAANAEIKPPEKGAKAGKGKAPTPAAAAKPKETTAKPKEAPAKSASDEKHGDKSAPPKPAPENTGDFNP